MEYMMIKIRGLRIASLGEGHYGHFLQLIDSKLCRHYFPDQSFYFHDEDKSIKKSSTKDREDAPQKPPIDELGTSQSIRSHPKGLLLCKASGFKVMRNFLGGQGN